MFTHLDHHPGQDSSKEHQLLVEWQHVLSVGQATLDIYSNSVFARYDLDLLIRDQYAFWVSVRGWLARFVKSLAHIFPDLQLGSIDDRPLDGI